MAEDLHAEVPMFAEEAKEDSKNYSLSETKVARLEESLAKYKKLRASDKKVAKAWMEMASKETKRREVVESKLLQEQKRRVKAEQMLKDANAKRDELLNIFKETVQSMEKAAPQAGMGCSSTSGSSSLSLSPPP